MRQFLLHGGFVGERPETPAPLAPSKAVPDWNRPGVQVFAGDENHTVVNADVMDFLECLPDNSVPLWLTDPPYCSGGATTASRKAAVGSKYGLEIGMSFEGDHRDQRTFGQWTDGWMRAALRKSRPDAGLLFVFSDWRQLPAVSDAIQRSGWTWRGVLTWDKRGQGRGLLWGFRVTAEYIVWASRGNPTDLENWPGGKQSVIRQGGVRDRIHMTEKPTAILTEIIGQVPDGRGPVVDPFVGSGATMAAAASLDRPSLGCDINPAFCRAAADRLGLK